MPLVSPLVTLFLVALVPGLYCHVVAEGLGLGLALPPLWLY